MSNPTTAVEIVAMFPEWRHNTHGWFECVWCHAATPARMVLYPEPIPPGQNVGHTEPENRAAHEAACIFVELPDLIDAYARQRVREALEEAETVIMLTWGRAYPDSIWPDPSPDDVAAVETAFPNYNAKLWARAGSNFTKLSVIDIAALNAR